MLHLLTLINEIKMWKNLREVLKYKTPHHFWQGVSNRAILNTNNPIKSLQQITTEPQAN